MHLQAQKWTDLNMTIERIEQILQQNAMHPLIGLLCFPKKPESLQHLCGEKLVQLKEEGSYFEIGQLQLGLLAIQRFEKNAPELSWRSNTLLQQNAPSASFTPDSTVYVLVPRLLVSSIVYPFEADLYASIGVFIAAVRLPIVCVPEAIQKRRIMLSRSQTCEGGGVRRIGEYLNGEPLWIADAPADYQPLPS